MQNKEIIVITKKKKMKSGREGKKKITFVFMLRPLDKKT